MPMWISWRRLGCSCQIESFAFWVLLAPTCFRTTRSMQRLKKSWSKLILGRDIGRFFFTNHSMSSNDIQWYPMSQSLIYLLSFFLGEQDQDQNFDRGTFVKSNPRVAACTIPKGRYILTKQWRVLTAEDFTCVMCFVIISAVKFIQLQRCASVPSAEQAQRIFFKWSHHQCWNHHNVVYESPALSKRIFIP